MSIYSRPTRFADETSWQNPIKTPSPRRREVDHCQLVLQRRALNPRIQVTQRLRLVDAPPSDGEHARRRRRRPSSLAGMILRNMRYSKRR